MNALVIADDDLRRLEQRFGPSVRRIGVWNSDGTFGYCSVPIAALEKAVAVLNEPAVSEWLQRLKETPDRTLRFIEMLQQFGSDLIDKLVAIHNEGFSMGSPMTHCR